MAGDSSQQYSREHAEAVLARAFELDAGAEAGLTVAQIRHIAAELGISEAAVASSLAEHAVDAVGLAPPPDHSMGRVLGPGRVAAVRTFPAGPSWAAHRLTRELHRRHLDLDAGDGQRACWTQRRAWWPDLHRVTAPTRVTTLVGEHPDGCLVRLEADLDSARRSHAFGAGLSIAAALAVPLLVPLAWTLPALAATVVGGPWLAMITFRRRARLVEERLDDLLASLV